MTRYSQIVTTPRIVTVCAGAFLAFALTVATLHASAPKSNSMTIRKAVALPGVVLTPGDYVFQLLDTQSGHVVRVASRNGESRFLGLTIPVNANRRAGDHTTIVLGEAPAGEPQPILSWFPDGLNQGEQFIYR
jgi:hypothetical protein